MKDIDLIKGNYYVCKCGCDDSFKFIETDGFEYYFENAVFQEYEIEFLEHDLYRNSKLSKVLE